MRQRLFYMMIALALLFQHNANAQDTFTWDSVPTTNGEVSVSETVSGVTATVTNSLGAVKAVNSGGWSGTNGQYVWAYGTLTVTFSSPTDITSIHILNAGTSHDGFFALTPTGGPNSAQYIPEGNVLGNTVTVNWTGVTSFTLYDLSSNPVGIDTIVFTGLEAPCTSPTAAMISATNTTICSGTGTTLTFSGDLNDATNWFIYSGSCGGTLVGTTTTSSINVNPTSTTTYYVRGEGGCVTPGVCATITITVTPTEDASFSYAEAAYCQSSPDPTPTISGVSGGNFSSTPLGLSINATTGVIDVSASTEGTYTVSYTTSGSCANSSAVTVQINANFNASFNYSAPSYCMDAANPMPTVSGSEGGTFSSAPEGLSIDATTGLIDVSASAAGSYTISYTLMDECASSENVTVDIIDVITVAIEEPFLSCMNSSVDLIGSVSTDSEGGYLENPTFLWTTTDGVIEGDTDELETSVSASGTYTLTVTAGDCSFSEDVVVDFNNVTIEETTWNGEAWSNGEPQEGMKAIIDGDLVIDSFFVVCELEVTENGSLTVQPSGFVGVIGKITNNATATDFVVENAASLAQLKDVQNVGPVTVNVTSFPLYRQDYTLWSSPVKEQNLRSFSPQTLFNRFSSYNPSLGTVGEYVQEIVTSQDVLTKEFAPANGYLIRTPNNWAEYVDDATPGVAYEGVFTGVPQNGTISVPLATVNGGFNLVGNPYPSPLAIGSLFDETIGMDQTVYFWRKRNAAAGSGYATYNNLGFSSAQPELNDFGTDFENNPVISPGQGFFIKSTGATTFNFTNQMRVPFSNGLFLKTASVEKHRMWLNLKNSTGIVGQTLIGYVSGATSGVDNGFDSTSFNDSSFGLTSLINGVEYAIQGLALPFDTASSVALGFKTDAAGTYSISLSNFDGLFIENQDIYIKDNVTGMIHNVKESAYSFTANEGIANDRFEVVYTNSVLGTANPELLVKNILVAVKDQSIAINAGTVVMDSIELIDLAGRVIYTQNDINTTTATIENVLTSNQMLVVRITTAENEIVNKKIIF